MSLREDEVGQAARALGAWMQSQQFDWRDILLLCQTMVGFSAVQVSNNKAEFEINLTRLKRDVETSARRAWKDRGAA
jgi:hypothetical protein